MADKILARSDNQSKSVLGSNPLRYNQMPAFTAVTYVSGTLSTGMHYRINNGWVPTAVKINVNSTTYRYLVDDGGVIQTQGEDVDVFYTGSEIIISSRSLTDQPIVTFVNYVHHFDTTNHTEIATNTNHTQIYTYNNRAIVCSKFLYNQQSENVTIIGGISATPWQLNYTADRVAPVFSPKSGYNPIDYPFITGLCIPDTTEYNYEAYDIVYTDTYVAGSSNGLIAATGIQYYNSNPIKFNPLRYQLIMAANLDSKAVLYKYSDNYTGSDMATAILSGQYSHTNDLILFFADVDGAPAWVNPKTF